MIPEQCILWKKSGLVPEDLYDMFDEVKVFHQNPDTSKRLLQCRECGQFYLYEYTGTADPKDSTIEILYVPVKKEGDTIEASTSGLPHIHVHWPHGQEHAAVRWVR